MEAHCGVCVFQGDKVGRFADRRGAYAAVTAKGTVRFTPDHPLPQVLVAEMVAARLAEIG